MLKIQKPQETFTFSKENQKTIKEVLGKYPEDRKASAVMPLLDLAQRQSGGWIPPEAIEEVAHLLEMPPIRVYEVASFYSMYNTKPVGKHLIQCCTTTPCWLRGADDVVQACKDHLGIEVGETTKDGLFTLMEVECLGACINAPMAQINDDYVENLDPKSVIQVLEDLKNA